MRKDEIQKSVIGICKNVLRDIEGLNEKSNALNTSGWDSLSHLNIISDIEDEFGISLTVIEISKSRSIGELVDAVADHLKTNNNSI